MIYNDLFATFGKLSVEQRGELITAIINQVTADMHLDGEVSQLCELLSIPFVERAKKDIEKYRAKCERNRTNANKRWVGQEDATACDGMRTDANGCERIQEDATACDAEQSHYNITKQNNNITKQNNNITKDVDKGANAPKRNTPNKPTKEAIAEYCKERNNGIDADYFFDYYEARGWKYSNNQPMKDFKAAVRTWERNNKGKGGASAPQMRTHPNVLHQEDMVYTDF